MFKEIGDSFLAGNHPFKEFAPYPKACERAAWEALDAETLDALTKSGERFIGFEYPYLKATDFMEFSRTGNRTNYEDKLFIKRKALNALVLAECAEHNGRFLDDIINGIFAICDETAWQLPAHNSYTRNTPQLILPDVSAPVIELFSCEAAAVLSTAYYLLKNELDAVSPYICSRIVYEVKRRVITPYITRHFWWMGRGKEEMCNWTIWCTQNILLTAFMLPLSERTRGHILKKACASTDYFLKDYGDDGCCDEGAQYYRHAGLCLYQTLDILCRVTNNYFNSLWQNEKIKNIALYILNVHVDDKYYINFADCSPVAGRAGIREYLFGKACDLDNLAMFAALDYKRNPDKFQPEENNMYYRLQEVFTRKAILSEDTTAAIFHPPVFYSSVGLWIARNSIYTAAAKCGDNNDSHNHNDTGSITLYKNGQPLLVDIGVESYTKKTFSPHRYEIWTMQSDYHNLPTINGCMQQNGAEYRATDVSHSFNVEGGSISMDIAKAYPAKAHIKTYNRSVSLTNAGLKLNDNWRFTDLKFHPVTLNFITYEKPVLKDNALLIGELGKITFPPDCNVQLEELPITDPRLMQCWKHSLYRIRISTVGNSTELFIS